MSLTVGFSWAASSNRRKFLLVPQATSLGFGRAPVLFFVCVAIK